jgi:C1A family cysteine protease
MSKNIAKKGFVIFILLLFIGMAFIVSSIKVNTTDSLLVTNPNESTRDPYSPDRGRTLYSVMEYVDLTPPEELSAKPVVMGTLPTSFSWMNYNGQDWTTPARDQAYCGSCWAFGAVSALESRINIAWNASNLDIDLSEQYILSCLSAAGSCAGGNSYAAYKFIQSTSAAGNYCNGIITESCLPYQADDTVPCSQKTPDWKTKLIPIVGYGSWNPHYPDDISAIKSQIVNEGPVVTYFYATNDFMSWGGSHHSPNDYYHYVAHDSLNHAVAIVGYKDDPSIGHGGYWIVKNSWGNGWGYNGFFNIEYGSLNIDNSQITWAEYNATPIVSFTTTPVNPDVGVPIHYTDASTPLLGQLTSWSWSFGDNSTSQDQNPTHSYTAVGTYPVTLQVTDSTGHTGSITNNVYVGDDASPVTNVTLFGTPGDNGWYTGSRLTFRLRAADVFSGVNYTMYNLDGSGFAQYYLPVSMYSNGNEGTHTLSFYSVDNVGNKESEKTTTIKIDTDIPTLTITKPANSRMYLFNIGVPAKGPETTVVGKLRSIVDASDNTSGINRVEFAINNQIKGADSIPPYTYDVRGFSKGTDVVLTVIAYDNAGKSTSVSTTFKFFGFWF